MNREIRLSQCMIVKNEEKNIERALSWGREIMYEQIVVDTGSTDQTVEIAERMGAKVFHFPWIDDFSAAKNYAIEQARGNWIAFLDADESYAKQDADKIPGILHDIEQNFNAKTKPHMIRSAMLCLRDDGTVLASYFQDRIFRNLNHLRYHNRVHEALGFPLGVSDPLIYYDATKDLTILHTGYTASTYQDTDKAERDIQLLRMELEKNPNDVMLLRYLGDALNSVGRQEEAETIYERAVELGIANMPQDAGPWILYNLMQHIYTRNNPEEELKLQQRYEQAEELAEGYPDFNYIMGLWFARRGDASRTICHLEQALLDLDAYQGFSPLYVSGALKQVYRLLAMAFIQSGSNKAATVKYAILSLRLDKYQGDCLQILLFLLKDDPGEDAQASGTLRILHGLYDFNLLKDKLVIHRCAQMAGFSNLADQIQQLLTDEENQQLLRMNLEPVGKGNMENYD